MAGFKIQLDHSALEALLGGEGEIEIRNSIAQEFARKHLKAIANAEGFQRFCEAEARAMRAETRALIEKHIGKERQERYSSTFELAPAIRERLDESCRRLAQEHIDRLLAETRVQIDRAAEASFAAKLSNIDALIDRRLEALTAAHIDARIKERLGAILDQAGTSGR